MSHSVDPRSGVASISPATALHPLRRWMALFCRSCRARQRVLPLPRYRFGFAPGRGGGFGTAGRASWAL